MPASLLYDRQRQHNTDNHHHSVREREIEIEIEREREIERKRERVVSSFFILSSHLSFSKYIVYSNISSISIVILV